MALNIYLGCNKQSSQNVMNETLHNLSMKVLSRSYNAFWLELEAMNRLTREINLLLNRKVTSFIKEQSNLPAL